MPKAVEFYFDYAADPKMQALLRVFKNPYEEEYYIVRAYYEDLLEEMARDKREREEQR